jgi:uncharacterized membrane protein YphA (DoxX/SURF4 family)
MPHRVTAETLRIIEVCGRVFVAIAMVGFGIQHFLYNGFLAGVELLPERIPGHTIWADLAGAVLIVCGALIAINKRSRLASIILANLFFLSELFRRLPGIGAIVQDLSKRTVVFETLSLGAGCLILAAMLPKASLRPPPRIKNRLQIPSPPARQPLSWDASSWSSHWPSLAGPIC